MASSFRGPSIRADFEHVLKTVGRGAAPRHDDDFFEEEPANPASHASFDFLQALDTVSDQRSSPADGHPGGRLAGGYAETELEAEPGADPETDQRSGTSEVGARASGAAPEGEASGEERAEPAGIGSMISEACDPNSLAAELGLRAGMTRAELKRLRRKFALANHPDRLRPPLRELASRRMTTANSLIDMALRRAIA